MGMGTPEPLLGSRLLTQICVLGPRLFPVRRAHGPKPSVAFRQKAARPRFGQPTRLHHIPKFNLLASGRKRSLPPGREAAWLLGLPWV